MAAAAEGCMAVDRLSEALTSIDCCGETSAAAAICGDDAIAGIAAYDW